MGELGERGRSCAGRDNTGGDHTRLLPLLRTGRENVSVPGYRETLLSGRNGSACGDRWKNKRAVGSLISKTLGKWGWYTFWWGMVAAWKWERNNRESHPLHHLPVYHIPAGTGGIHGTDTVQGVCFCYRWKQLKPCNPAVEIPCGWSGTGGSGCVWLL